MSISSLLSSARRGRMMRLSAAMQNTERRRTLQRMMIMPLALSQGVLRWLSSSCVRLLKDSSRS